MSPSVTSLMRAMARGNPHPWNPEENLRVTGSGVAMSHLRQDLRFAVRGLLRRPGLTIVALLTLALGLGANTAMFSVVNTVLLSPPPFKDIDRLVMVWASNPVLARDLGFPDTLP